jgi:hypothetical protein
MKKSFALFAVVSLVASCGGNERSGKSESSVTPESTAGEIANDEESTSAAVSSNLDEAVASLAGDSSASTSTSGGASFGLAGTADKDFQFEKSCEIVDGKALVKVSSSGERTKVLDRSNFSHSLSFSGESSQERLWFREGVALECQNDHAKFDWKSAGIEGLKLDLKFKRARALTHEFVNKKKGTTKSSSFSFLAQGERSIVWGVTEVSAESTTAVRVKTISSNVQRSLSFVKKNGEKKEISHAVVSKEPLVVKVERNKETASLVSRTIDSGLLVATHIDDSRLETSFSKLKVSMENGECLYVSGSMSAKFFEKDGVEAKRAFEISFVDGQGSIKNLLNGESKEFVPAGCDSEDLQ